MRWRKKRGRRRRGKVCLGALSQQASRALEEEDTVQRRHPLHHSLPMSPREKEGRERERSFPTARNGSVLKERESVSDTWPAAGGLSYAFCAQHYLDLGMCVHFYDFPSPSLHTVLFPGQQTAKILLPLST